MEQAHKCTCHPIAIVSASVIVDKCKETTVNVSIPHNIHIIIDVRTQNKLHAMRDAELIRREAFIEFETKTRAHAEID